MPSQTQSSGLPRFTQASHGTVPSAEHYGQTATPVGKRLRASRSGGRARYPGRELTRVFRLMHSLHESARRLRLAGRASAVGEGGRPDDIAGRVLEVKEQRGQATGRSRAAAGVPVSTPEAAGRAKPRAQSSPPISSSLISSWETSTHG